MVGHGGVQADMVLEKELRVLYLYLKATGHWVYFEHRRETSKPIPTVTYFRQQGHIYSNKSTPPNSATLCELMGTNSIQYHRSAHASPLLLWQ